MLNVSAFLDLFTLPVPGPDYKTLLDTGFNIPPIKRRVGFYVDYTKHLVLGGSASLEFRSSHNFDAQVCAGPLTLTLTFSKPWEYEAWFKPTAAGTAQGADPTAQALPDPQ